MKKIIQLLSAKTPVQSHEDGNAAFRTSKHSRMLSRKSFVVLLLTTLFLTSITVVQATWIQDTDSNDALYYDPIADRIGIGTTSPLSKLHVSGDDGALFTGTFGSGTIPVEGPGTRLMWYPGKAALRAGEVGGTAWDSGNVGICSTAMGYSTTASGNNSTAMGNNTAASGNNSTALGRATIASGDASTAIGKFSTASGNYSTALGISTTASGDYAHAMGVNSTASGLRSTAMGSGTTASGSYSTTMGTSTIASGNWSTAIGRRTTAQAIASFVIGRYNEASGDPLNWVDTDPLFVIGNGSSDTSLSNALTVLKNGKVGIGVTNPSGTLDVTGILNADNLNVDTVSATGSISAGSISTSTITSAGDICIGNCS